MLVLGTVMAMQGDKASDLRDASVLDAGNDVRGTSRLLRRRGSLLELFLVSVSSARLRRDGELDCLEIRAVL